MLDQETVEKKIIGILGSLQDAGGFTPTKLRENSCPVADMPEFDSQIWVLAMTLVADELEIAISESANIFVSSTGDSLDIKTIAKNIVANAEKLK